MTGRKNRRDHGYKSSEEKKANTVTVDECNPVVLCFMKLAQELDEKHDRYERIVKINRDITIESKRIIFLLHTYDLRKDNASKIIEEARTRLHSLCANNFLAIAKELKDQDPYKYARAYSAGLQEFIEAYTFYEYISGTPVSGWDKLQTRLCYDHVPQVDKGDENGAQTKVDEGPTHNQIQCLIQPIEFILGLADLSGEVMRRCINSLGNGDVDTCFQSRKFMQLLFSNFISISTPWNRELSRKTHVLRQSMIKTENVCYNVKVRGREAAKWGSVDSKGGTDGDADEGFF